MIYGLARAGVTVHATHGTWLPRPDAYRYEWRLNGEPINGATTSALKVTTSMAGQQLAVTVIAVEAGHADGLAGHRARVGPGGRQPSCRRSDSPAAAKAASRSSRPSVKWAQPS